MILILRRTKEIRVRANKVEIRIRIQRKLWALMTGKKIFSEAVTLTNIHSILSLLDLLTGTAAPSTVTFEFGSLLPSITASLPVAAN